jgi:hypothetical protein
MKQVTEVPPPEYGTLRDPWLDGLFDGNLRQLDEEDWRPRYRTSRSAASAIHAAAVKRGVKATVNVRGETLYVQGGSAPIKSNGRARKAPARPGAAKKAAAKV